MGRYVINLSELADDQTQEIIIPITLPDYTRRGVPHGQISRVVALVTNTGGIMIELDVRSEDHRMVHHLRYGFWPGELIRHADQRRHTNTHH